MICYIVLRVKDAKVVSNALIFKTSLMWGFTPENHCNVWVGKQSACEELVRGMLAARGVLCATSNAKSLDMKSSSSNITTYPLGQETPEPSASLYDLIYQT